MIVTEPSKHAGSRSNGPREDGQRDELVIRIAPQTDWRIISVSELWRYRELAVELAWRDIKVRYKQTVLGAAWALIQPVATMAVFTLLFRNVVGDGPKSYPYFLFALTGLLPWFYFSNSISSAAQSVVGNQTLVTKVYFPRLLIPLASIGPFLLDFAIGFVLLMGLMLVYGAGPTWAFIFAALILAGITVAALGVGILLAALTVAYRDFRHAVPFLIQLWMFATPAIYLPTRYDTSGVVAAFLPLNPMQGLISNFRVAVLGGEFDFYSLAVSGSVAVITFLLGCCYFRRVERTFADII